MIDSPNRNKRWRKPQDLDVRAAACSGAQYPHMATSGGSGHLADTTAYGSPRARLSEAGKALEGALKHLGDVDPSIYSVKERA